MTKRMLIDATHAEETRVVVLDGNRLEDYDVETAAKRQLKGNIYLAKVVRVEPSLQAAFVEYGGNRHGFLAFSEIHPDYYQIPVADRQRLIELQEEEARAEEEAEDAAAAAGEDPAEATPETASPPADAVPEPGEAAESPADAIPARRVDETISAELPEAAVATEAAAEPDASAATEPAADTVPEPAAEAPSSPETEDAPTLGADLAPEAAEPVQSDPSHGAVESVATDSVPPETVGGDGDSTEEGRERRIPPRFLRNYKIQEVIRRRQILLVQVVKEERGTKGAALTTYISLAGRYSVLMPNSPRGGGISRKITSAADRKRLREAMTELAIPRGMGMIVRTAGANRPKAEIKRDCEYLLRLWDDIRERTLGSVAPALIHEEASLIKRAIRDVYSRDVDEVVVDGEDGWRSAREFMRMLMPSHARKVQLWKDPAAEASVAGGQKLFARQNVEAQLDAMLTPTVQLKSGGYLVINQTEALVAIDVNSGRSTRERGIEETALRTNLEAADEVARQLRLRDLAGLIVIDFIDMEAKKHNGMVERRLKEALKTDRARIQVGHISHFGLMEMSRQRLRPSLAETSFSPCPHCGGTGHVRSVESAALHVLRAIEEEGAKRRAAEIAVHVAGPVAMYVLNHKRDWLAGIERAAAMHVSFIPDDSLIPPEIRIDRLRPQEAPAPAAAQPQPEPQPAPVAIPEIDEADEEGTEVEANPETSPAAGEDGERRRRRRRRRRRGGRREETAEQAVIAAEAPEQNGDLAASPAEQAEAETPPAAPEAETEAGAEPAAQEAPPEAEPAEGAPSGEAAEPAEAGPRRPRRRRTGTGTGRRRREEKPATIAVTEPPAYAGPTPADPFGNHTFDIFDMLEQQMQASPPPVPAEQPVVTAEAAPPAEPEPAPVREMETAAAEPSSQEAVPAPEPEPSPVVKPIVIGSAEDAIVEKKRGWWRR